MPPATPASRMATTIQRPVSGPASSATPAANTAPRMNCPSAPMFHTLERKHTASPSAMISSGVALTISSEMRIAALDRLHKEHLQAAHRVFAQQRKQDHADHHRDQKRQQRRGIAPARRRLGTDFKPQHGRSPSCCGGLVLSQRPGHPFADALDGGVGPVHAGREPPLGNHVQAVADLEQFVELFAHHQHCAARVAQRQDLAADLRRSAHVHTPGGLAHDQELRLGLDLAADDELLQVAARERLGRRVRPVGLDVVAA